MVVVQQQKEDAKAQEQSAELFAELDRAKRKRNCFSCRNLGCLFLVVLIGLVIGAAGWVASTGAIKIPVLSSLFYPEAPEPQRVVDAAVDSVDVTKILENALKNQLEQTTTLDGEQVVKLTLTEKELSALLRIPNDKGEVFLKQGQVVIDSNGAELYGKKNFKLFPETVVIRIDFIPVGEDVAMARARLGFARLPLPTLIQGLGFNSGSIGELLEQVINRLMSRPGQPSVDIKKTILGEGKIELLFDPSVLTQLGAQE